MPISDIGLLTIETTVTTMLVEALIATHPDPAKVRQVFDQMWGQFQANSLAAGDATPESLKVAQTLIEKIFSPPASP